jgi:hypothetical protein
MVDRTGFRRFEIWTGVSAERVVGKVRGSETLSLPAFIISTGFRRTLRDKHGAREGPGVPVWYTSAQAAQNRLTPGPHAWPGRDPLQEPVRRPARRRNPCRQVMYNLLMHIL